MSLNLSGLSPSERYKLVGKLIEEIKLRKYSFQTGKAYLNIVKDFLKSGKTARNFCFLTRTAVIQPYAALILP